jgi:hypothetical protein
MHTPVDTPSFGMVGPRIVYVKTVAVEDLPEDMKASAGGRAHLYAVHDAEGEQLALVADRKLAFVLARQNDFSPVAVH